MKLADYLFQSGLSPSDLKNKLGVSSRMTVLRYLTGERVPSPPILQKIIELSGGLVQLRDFLSPGNPECAIVIVLPNGRKKLVFPWASNKADLQRATDAERKRAVEQDNLSEPFRQALKEVADLVRRRADGTYLLEGRPADLRRIVAEANKRRKAQGFPPIIYPGSA
jgi:hypothetical protein